MSQPSTCLQVTQHKGVLSLTLNRPDAFNALCSELVEALIAALEHADDVSLCVIRGNGRHFCAGFDLSDIESLNDAELLWRFLRIEHLLQAIYHAKFPVVAFAQGHVIGAGADLFSACWQRIAAEDVKIKMPGWNFELALGTRRLKNLIGADAARDLLIDTQTYDVQQAIQCRLVSQIAEVDVWSGLIENLYYRSTSLSSFALGQMLDLTRTDTRDEDLASIAKTAGRPGLKKRIMDYRERVIKAKRK